MHRTTDQFWERYQTLPADIQSSAEKSFQLLKKNPRHPSLQFKKVGNFWSGEWALPIERWQLKMTQASYGYGSAAMPITRE